MTVTRRFATALALAAATALPLVAGAAPAGATALTTVAATAGASDIGDGSWRPYGNTNPITASSSTWRCAGSKKIASDVIAQVCAIRSPGGTAAQGAVIVRNNRSSLFSARVYVDLSTADVVMGDWICSSSGVGPHSWSVCFGRTLSVHAKVHSEAWVNDRNYLGESPWA
ncbi:hypothetical protein HII36_11635 [Nonomuraea sp. NN258]|uniref:hypothetical protein n=1 Tax=Nonomuraea antri TaxID=2730852 RepID=UPI0015691F95|nr:hypothetical protein [Nonomuraea antri]NRQ32485.1 hypothetical protein [Nonomuraea antri]